MYASVDCWGICNTMKAGRRHSRSTRPSLEAMEGRTLLTAPDVCQQCVGRRARDGPGDHAVYDRPDLRLDASGDRQLPDIELDGDCGYGLHRRCWDAHHSGGSDIRR